MRNGVGRGGKWGAQRPPCPVAGPTCPVAGPLALWRAQRRAQAQQGRHSGTRGGGPACNKHPSRHRAQGRRRERLGAWGRRLPSPPALAVHPCRPPSQRRRPREGGGGEGGRQREDGGEEGGGRAGGRVGVRDGRRPPSQSALAACPRRPPSTVCVLAQRSSPAPTLLSAPTPVHVSQLPTSAPTDTRRRPHRRAGHPILCLSCLSHTTPCRHPPRSTLRNAPFLRHGPPVLRPAGRARVRGGCVRRCAVGGGWVGARLGGLPVAPSGAWVGPHSPPRPPYAAPMGNTCQYTPLWRA